MVQISIFEQIGKSKDPLYKEFLSIDFNQVKVLCVSGQECRIEYRQLNKHSQLRIYEVENETEHWIARDLDELYSKLLSN